MISFLPLLLAFLLLSSTDPASARDWRQTRLPESNITRADATTSDYHKEPINLSDPKGKEPLIDLEDSGIATDNFYARKDGLNSPYFKSFATAPLKASLRESVVSKLVQVNNTLKPYGVELLVLDGYRPVSLQKELWSYFIEQAKKVRPALNTNEQVKYASRYCSNPSNFDCKNSQTWPTHATGAAVDVTLRYTSTGKQLFMGGDFDDASKISHTNYYEKDYKSPRANLARHNRRLLFLAMKNQDFGNYPYEWWHFDYGNQLWLMQKHNDRSAKPGLKAWYGLAQ